MIEEYTLRSLLEKYNINTDKIINKNNNILTYGEYQDIDATLNYLINELEIDRSNIEKCPSILYRNVGDIKANVNFLKDKKVKFEDVETCLHVLSTDSQQLVNTYDYVEKNYGIDVINKTTSILRVTKLRIISIENLNILLKNKNDVISVSIGINSIEEIQEIINSKEFKEHPELFTSTTLAHAKLKDIQEIINSKEFKEHPELFTSETLARATLKEIQEIINSKEFKEHPELFTSTTLAHATLKEIQEIINSKEFKEHPELFTSETLAHAKLKDIQEIINSKEFKEHPELFTSQVLAHAKLKEIQEIINSKEFKEHPELFTSTTLAHAKLKDIQEIINSKEFKEHPELFTSETLAHAKLKEIQEIINSKEFKEHPELFTSTTLAHAKLKEIQALLELPYWKDEKYRRLLTSSVLANSKSIIKKLPVLFKMAEDYDIDNYLNVSFLRKSPSQNYALINYLIDNDMPLVIDYKLNSIFSYQPVVLKKKYNIDIKQLMQDYPLPVYENIK